MRTLQSNNQLMVNSGKSLFIYYLSIFDQFSQNHFKFLREKLYLENCSHHFHLIQQFSFLRFQHNSHPFIFDFPLFFSNCFGFQTIWQFFLQIFVYFQIIENFRLAFNWYVKVIGIRLSFDFEFPFKLTHGSNPTPFCSIFWSK